MKLNIPERIALYNILPIRSNIVTLRILQKLRSDLSFSAEENKHYGIKNTIDPNGERIITWNPELSEETKDIEIGDAQRGIIVEQLKMLSERNRLHVSMLPIYEKFVEDKT